MIYVGYNETPIQGDTIMSDSKNSVPATLIYVSNRELAAVTIVCGTLIYAGFILGRAVQRKFVEEHMHLVTKN